MDGVSAWLRTGRDFQRTHAVAVDGEGQGNAIRPAVVERPLGTDELGDLLG
jgi:hypothetical protein